MKKSPSNSTVALSTTRPRTLKTQGTKGGVINGGWRLLKIPSTVYENPKQQTSATMNRFHPWKEATKKTAYHRVSKVNRLKSESRSGDRNPGSPSLNYVAFKFKLFLFSSYTFETDELPTEEQSNNLR
ncbi:Uncharacterized protein Fot_48293 [Forsythia ovata]|uniref:Uncharacterized protein n=1 Tax=Forsythia ovata TaxID=205694 RepID=A0ABD1Q8S5_9LAMI